MPTSSRNGRELDEKKGSRVGKSLRKSASFHIPSQGASQTLLRRPKTDPNLLSFSNIMFMNKVSLPSEVQHTTSKVLLNVRIQRSLGAVQVVMSQESTVGELITAAVRRYTKEERRPFLPTTDPSCFNLHYSPFDFQSLDLKERLTKLGSRNFFLCLHNDATTAPCKSTSSMAKTTTTTFSSSSPSSRTSCSNQVVETMAPHSTTDRPWLRFTQLMM